MTLTFQELTKEVGEWSLRNFGNQNGLNEAAPLLGMIEEMFYELVSCRDCQEDRDDAYADTVIFFADFCSRAGVGDNYLRRIGLSLSIKVTTENNHLNCAIDLPIGKLAQTVLKSFQGIRGRSRDDTEQVGEDAVAFAHELESQYHLLEGGCTSLMELASWTWEKVKKRDWKNNPEDAHEKAGQ